jgi:hypothetical protein
MLRSSRFPLSQLSIDGPQGYGPTNEGNFKPTVDTLAILTEKAKALQTNFAGIGTPGQRWQRCWYNRVFKVYRAESKAVKVHRALKDFRAVKAHPTLALSSTSLLQTLI